MSAGYLELFLEQGEDFSVSVTLDGINGEPYNLTDHTVKSDIRKSHWSENKTESFVASIENASLGIIRLTINSNTTQLISSGRYVYDVFITNSVNNVRSKVLEGMLFIEPSATKK